MKAVFYSSVKNKSTKIIAIEKIKIIAILFISIEINIIFTNYKINFNQKYLTIFKNLFKKKQANKKIRIGIYTIGIRNGGRARITAILLNHLHKIKYFNLYLLTLEDKKYNDYLIPSNTIRIVNKNNLITILKKNKIEILIYELSSVTEINKLNKLKETKVIFYLHSSIFSWIYTSLSYFKLLYNNYKKSKYVISLVPFENDYLFKKWGIRSILMTNFMTYQYNNIIPSDLSSKTILMIGRVSDRNKRFYLGIKAMKYIVKEVPESHLLMIGSLSGISYLQNLIKELSLEKNTQFVRYTPSPHIYFKNASLHIFPTIYESFGLVLSETKIYGIPNILLGLDYVSIAKGGTIIIYDDNPESIAKEAIKILTNYRYRKKMGAKARKSVKQFNNDHLLLKWIKLILSVYRGDYYYELLRNQQKKMSNLDALNIINSQIKLLKMRVQNFKYITINKFLHFI